jgi:hypothetical protein
VPIVKDHRIVTPALQIATVQKSGFFAVGIA